MSFKFIRILFCFFPLVIPLNVIAKVVPGYAVASANPIASYVGIEVLNNGGNAFDAAVAVAAALGVVEPYHSGLGGGSFWLLHIGDNGENIFIDAREVAPKASKVNMFLNEAGEVQQELSINGGLAAAIPGQPAALAHIAKKYGSLPLSQTLAPAIKLAEEGFKVDKEMQNVLNMQDRLAQLKKYPAASDIFLKHGKPYQVGELFKQKDLANTLKILSTEGQDGFYKGKIANLLVQGVNQAGGVWTLDDLKNYKLKIRQPLTGNFQGMKIITAPLPSAGGVTLVMMLNILSHYDLQALTQIQWIHYLVEAMRLSYWQRTLYLGDPDFVKVNVDKLLSPKNINYLNSLIKPNEATPSSTLSKNSKFKSESKNTTHFSILDSHGNRVAVTLTINHIFGSSVVAKGTGVLLNDEMDDFSIQPNVSNLFGLIGSEMNRIEPGKRPLSSMTPTFLEYDENIAILGTPGGSRIPTMVLIGALKFKDTLSAITIASSLRFHHQYLPDVLQFEPNAISKKVQRGLEDLGYVLRGLQQYYGNMQVITWNKKTNLITATSDPRRIGLSIVMKEKNKEGYGFQY